MSLNKAIKAVMVCFILASTFVAGRYCYATDFPIASKEVSGKTLYLIYADSIVSFKCDADHKASWNSIPTKSGKAKFDVSGDWQISKDGSLILRYKTGIHIISIISKDTANQFWTVLTEHSEKTKRSTRVYFTLTNAINYLEKNH